MESNGQYGDRVGSENSDGTPLFATDYDKANESDLIKLIHLQWPSVKVHPYGRLCPIDFWAERDGRLAGTMELKSRSHSSERFPDVFLNVRKWIALMLAQTALGVVSLFIVRFTDKTGYCRVMDIDASQVVIAGCRNKVKSHSDIEPVIKVPITAFKWFK